MKLDLEPETLAPLIERVVQAVMVKMEANRPQFDDRLAYGEQEAARLLSLAPLQLRDERLRGRIHASQIVGRRIRYTKADLLGYLAEREWKH